LRLFVKAVGSAFHVFQRERDGTEHDLTDAISLQGTPVSETDPTSGYVLVYNSATGEWEPTASSTPGAHVLATTAGLGAAHTTSGLTAGQVLRATAAAAAAFAAIQDGDVPASHSGSAHHAAVTIGADGEHSLAGQVLSGVAATAAQAGHATTAQITKLDGIATGADVTSANAPKAHKDSHDPNDGSDPLDTAAASEISAVVAAGAGTSHSLARADHIHAISHAITDNHLVTVDQADAADNDYAKFTADGLEGRSYTELKTDIGLDAAAIAAVEGEATLVLTGAVTIAAGKTLEVNTINEKTGAAGVTIEGVLVKKDLVDGRDVSADGAILDATKVSCITVIIDGGGSAITTGIKCDVEVPFACTINQNTLLADQSGSIVVDLWVDTYANYPPTDADSITAAAPPTIAAATKSQDATLTDWTTAIAAGKTIRYNVDSCTSITRVTLSLKVTHT
jgi:hypothetical protein